MIKKETLSTRELATKVDSIEQQLDSRLLSLTSSLDRNIQTSGIQSVEEDRYNLVIDRLTQAFAYATKVYLNVLVSGPNPQVLEILEGVGSTITSLKSLPDPLLLRSAVWPFCIAGSMATTGQRQAFRDLAAAAKIDAHVFGTSRSACEVMETCWKMRDEGHKSCDWRDAMKTLGHLVLLV
jgi:hypothetical protein